METLGDDLVPISALEHYSYCPRQCGLIHIEQFFEENAYTTRGTLAHRRVHESGHEARPGIRTEFALPVWSDRLGLIGRADVVEFSGPHPYPVEHKIGKKRQWGHEAIQLCAQALCLEEMLGQPVPRGAIYYHGSRARREIEFDAPLRELVARAVADVRALLAGGELPAAIDDARCRHCSLRDACLPQVVSHPQRARLWDRALYLLDDERGGTA